VKIMLPAHWSSEPTVKWSERPLLGPSSNLENSDGSSGADWRSTIPAYSRDIHPVDEELEEFHFGRVSARQRRKIESHLHYCHSCRGVLDHLREFIVTLSCAIEWNRMLPESERRIRVRAGKRRTAKQALGAEPGTP
jgi:hypothetical protein